MCHGTLVCHERLSGVPQEKSTYYKFIKLSGIDWWFLLVCLWSSLVLNSRFRQNKAVLVWHKFQQANWCVLYHFSLKFQKKLRVIGSKDWMCFPIADPVLICSILRIIPFLASCIFKWWELCTAWLRDIHGDVCPRLVHVCPQLNTTALTDGIILY